ncbi:MAG: tol-pal system protein YbgF [Burkholderiaceae bacterium]|nr:tol-pal system protein YbgF [Burkholderiaceae bacterium]
MMRARALVFAAAFAALTGLQSSAQAALFSDDEARKAILDLRGRVQVMQQETNQRLDELSRQMGELGARVERIDQTARGQLELQSQLESLRQEVARLRGQLEVQSHELATAQRQLGDQLATVDTRISKFEPVAAEIDGRSVTVDQNEKRAFDAALQMFRAGDYRGALAAFQSFRSQYPDSPYLPGVLFWVGSSQFALKDYKGAIASQQALLARYPDNARAPDALFNVGYAQAESGDRKAARATLEQVVAKYPDSQAAKRAREQIASLPAR